MTDRAGAAAEIRRLKAQYFRCVDGKRWDELSAVFARDAVVAGTDHPQGRDGIVAHIRTVLDGKQSVHHGRLIELSVADDGKAHAVWSMTDVVEPTSGVDRSGWAGSGRYHEKYVYEDGAWRIAHMRLERTRRDPVSAPRGVTDVAG